MQPRQAFFGKVVFRGPKPRGLIERTDMEMRYRQQGQAFIPSLEFALPDPSAVEAEFKECRKGDYTMTDQEKLQMLFDRTQIGEAIHRYPVSIDSRNWKLCSSVLSSSMKSRFTWDLQPTSSA